MGEGGGGIMSWVRTVGRIIVSDSMKPRGIADEEWGREDGMSQGGKDSGGGVVE